MAARENQGYLIAVIILVLLSLALALVSFLGVQKAYEQAEAAEASEAKLKVANLIAEAETLKGRAYQAIIGGELGPTPSELEQVLQDLGRLSTNAALSADDRGIIEGIVADVRTAKELYQVDTQGGDEDENATATFHDRILELTSTVGKQRQDYKVQVGIATEAAAAAAERVTAAESARDDSAKELAELQQKRSKEIQEAKAIEIQLQDQVTKSNAAITSLKEELTEAASKAAVEINEARNQVTVLEEQQALIKKELNDKTRQTFDNPDGKIIHVASKLKTVFIDKGSADGLTNNRTFSVYDKFVTNFITSPSKASIEIVQVFPFRSECRIISENPVDPILPGDFILSPTWNPGFSLKIALAGRFDLDGDRFEDTEKLIRLIEQNGGQVVARHDEKGEITGEVSPVVRYLVTGNQEIIDGEEGDANAGKILIALAAMVKEAEANTVQKIDLPRLLDRMGVRAKPKTRQLDFPPGGFTERPANPGSDFVPRQPGSLEGSSSR